MKTWKRVLTVLLTAALVAGMGLTAFAADDSPKASITINNVEPGHTMYAYQIFTGDVSDGQLTNIEWGNGITDYGKGALCDHYGLTESADRTAAKVAAALATYNVEDMDAATVADARAIDFADAVSSFYNRSGRKQLTYTEGTRSASVGGLDPGYYVIVDTSYRSDNDFALSRAMVRLVGEDVTIDNKTDKPNVDKKIVEGDVEGKETSINIGDVVDFKITSTVPNCEGYTKYFLRFEDTMSKGLVYEEDSLKVTIGEDELDPSDDYTVTIGEYSSTNGTSINVEIVVVDEADPTHSPKYGTGKPITITYQAKTNADLKSTYIYYPYQYSGDNRVHLVYSNDPNNTKSTGKTPDVIVYVRTANFQIVKTTDLKTGYKNLEGAEFRIYEDPECTKEVKLINTGDTYTQSYGVPVDKRPVSPIYRVMTPEEEAAGAQAVSVVGGHPIIAGLKYKTLTVTSTTYYVKEVKAPSGFSMMDPNPVEIELKETSNLASFIMGDEHPNNDVHPEEYRSSQAFIDHPVSDWPEWTGLSYTWGAKDFNARKYLAEIGDYSKGGIHVIDKAGGSVLPDTGGIGTTIFYVIGAVLVIGAGVILVTRRRMDSSK